MPFLVGYITPQDYGAAGDGTTDDTAAIQAALNACPVDGQVYFPVGKYATTAPLTLPPGVTMYGQTQLRPRNAVSPYASLASNVYIAPKASFAGAAVILVNDALTGGYTTMAQNSRIIGIHLACEAIPSGSIDGIRVFGQVQGLVMENVSVTGPSGYCYNFAKDASISTGPVAPWSMRMRGCYGGGGGAATTIGGVLMYAPTDGEFIDCEMIGVGGDGWQIQGGSANIFIGCRSENNTGWGFHMTQTALGGAPTASLIGCHTDLNTLGGYSADQAGLVTFDGCISDGEGASVAGFDIRNATGVVRLSDCVANPSSGTNSQYGLNVQNANIIIVEGGAYYGSTAGYHNGGTITTLYLSPNVVALTGTVTSPTATTAGVGMSGGGGIGMAASIPNQPAINIASPGSTPLQIVGAATGQKIGQFNGADATTIAMATLVTGDSLDRFRQLVDGSAAYGPGSGARDTNTGRATTGTWYASPTLLVGASTALGDNGSGEIQLHNATTVPTTNPTAGLDLYANAGQAVTRNPQGLVQTLSSVIQVQTSTTTVTGVTAETVLHTVTIPANDPAAGAVYHMTGYGVYTGVSGTLDFITRWGGVAGTLIASISTAFNVIAASNIPFWYDVTITFRSTTSCTAAINLEMAQTATGGADNAVSYVGSPAAATTVTTTGSSALVVDVLPSVSTTSVSLLGGCVRRLA